MKPTYSIRLAFALLFLAGCASISFMYKDIPVSKGSAEAGTGSPRPRRRRSFASASGASTDGRSTDAE